MKRFVVLACACLLAFGARAHVDRPEQVAGFLQRIGEALPLESTFVDDSGRRAPLGSWIAGQPVVVVFGYLRCPDLCDTTLAGISESLDETTLVPGRDYRALFVSIDPEDTASGAAAVKAKRLPAGKREAWHFLTGGKASIARLTQAAGFNFRYDAERLQYAHPAGFVVVTPEGVIARYFPGVRFEAAALRAALTAAGEGRTGARADPLRLLCYHLDPAGRHTGAILTALRAAVLAFALAGAVFLWRTLRRGGRPTQ